MAAATQKIIIHADDKTGTAIASAIRNTKKLDGQIQRTSNNMRTATRQGRAHFGQLGHQIQDVAVQFQMGMNPLMILGQQGSQVASIFGAKGAVIGSFIAVAAVIGSQLVPALFNAKKGFADLRKEVEGVGLSVKDMPAELLAANLELLESNTEQARQSLGNLESKLADAKAALSSAVTQSQIDPYAELGDIVGNAKSNIEKLERQLLEAKVAFLVAQQATKNFKDEIADATEKVKDLELAQRKANREANTRMELLMAAESAESQFIRRQKEIERVLKGQDNAFDDTELKAYQKAIEDLTKELFPAGKEIKDLSDKFKLSKITMQEVEFSGVRSLEDALVDISTQAKTAKEAFRDMAMSILEDIVRMNIRNAFTATLSGASGGILSSISGGIAGAFGGLGSTGTVPYQSTQQAFPVAHPPPKFEGGGFTGMGGRSGGIDGRGGFPAILHPNETVIDHSKGQGGGVTVNLNISTGVSQTVRAEIANLLPQITQATQSAVADARMRGGSFSKAMVGS